MYPYTRRQLLDQNAHLRDVNDHLRTQLRGCDERLTSALALIDGLRIKMVDDAAGASAAVAELTQEVADAIDTDAYLIRGHVVTDATDTEDGNVIRTIRVRTIDGTTYTMVRVTRGPIRVHVPIVLTIHPRPLELHDPRQIETDTLTMDNTGGPNDE